MLRVDQITKLVQDKRMGDLYILARYFYREGSPCLPDPTYDKIHNEFVKVGYLDEYTNRTYDEDPVPYELLEEFNILPLNATAPTGRDNPHYDFVTAKGTFSIRAVTEYEEVWGFVKGHAGQDFMLSLKVDGVKIRNALEKQRVALSLSRGRNGGEPWEATRQMQLILGKAAESIETLMAIDGEAFVEKAALPYLAEYYDSNKPPHERRFKLPRAAAITMLRKSMEASHYKYCKFLAFACDGLDTTVSGTFSKLEEKGFDVVPHILIKADEVPKDYETFVPWMIEYLDRMRDLQGDIPADGVVMEVNNLHADYSVNHQYLSNNIAIKLEHWSHEYYVGIVRSVEEIQRSVVCAYVALIEPFKTSDNRTASRINVFNPNLIIEENIKEGSRLYFESNSGAVNIMIHGSRKPLELEPKSSAKSNSFGGG